MYPPHTYYFLPQAMFDLLLLLYALWFQSKAAYVLFYTRRDDPETRSRMMSTSELNTEDINVFQNSDEEEVEDEDDAMEPAN